MDENATKSRPGLGRLARVAALAMALILAACGSGRDSARPATTASAQGAAEAAVPPALLAPAALAPEARVDLAALQAAYPGSVLGLAAAPGGPGLLDLVLAGNVRVPYHDGRARTPEQALTDPDVRTMLAQVYPLGPVTEATARPAPHFDPGRSRVQGFFTALYGGSEAEVRASCVAVPFLRRKPQFTTRHGAAQALERVGRRLAALPIDDPAYRRILQPVGGAFVWRVIAGTGRLSMHSFGIAVDLNPSLPYWLTEEHPEGVPAQCRSFPPEILAAFEAEGFIWGGKWAAFDLMHFEYRPELILKARAMAAGGALP